MIRPPRELGHGSRRAGTRRFRDHHPRPASAEARPSTRRLPTTPPAPPQLIAMGGGSRALSLSSLCATTLAAARAPAPFLAPAHRALLPLRLAAVMSSSSSSQAPAAPAASGDAAAAPAPAPSASNAIDFLTLCYRLKVSRSVPASHFRGLVGM